MPAPAYLIVEMHITDPEQYKQYMAAAPAAVKAYGGEYVVRGGRHETLEGDWQPHRVALLKGRMPVSKSLPYQWYDTPNVHLCTFHDFEDLCKTLKVEIIERRVMTGDSEVQVLPNLLGSMAAYRFQRGL